MKSRKRWGFSVRLWALGSMPLLILAGCGGVKTHPVSGKITYADGTPMPGGGQIAVTPVDKEAKFSARGEIKGDGTFRLSTFSENDGVPEGKYKVVIVPTPPPNPNRPPPDWPPLHKKYIRYERTDLEYTVTSGRNDWHLVVEK